MVDEDTVVTEGWFEQLFPGKVFDSRGVQVDDEDAVYALRVRLLILWPFDENAKLVGEDSYCYLQTASYRGCLEVATNADLAHAPPPDPAAGCLAAFASRLSASTERNRGRRTVKVVPSSAVEVTVTVPPLATTISRTMYNPSPALPGFHCSADSQVA